MLLPVTLESVTLGPGRSEPVGLGFGRLGAVKMEPVRLEPAGG